MTSAPNAVPVHSQLATKSQAAKEQSFHFVEPQNGKSRHGHERRDVRSFVMQKARRERPWSTSKRVKYALHGGTTRESIGSSASLPAENALLQSQTQSRKGKMRQLMQDNTPSGRSKTGIDYLLGCQSDSNEMQWCDQLSQLDVGFSLARDSVAYGGLDPFSSYPIDLDERGIALVEHCTRDLFYPSESIS